FRRHRACSVRWSCPTDRWRPAGLPRDSGADGAAVAAHFSGADAVLQNRRRLPGLAQWIAGPFYHRGRAAKRQVAVASRRAVPARRQGARAARSGARRRPDEPAARGTRTGMNIDGLSINLATVREQWNLREAVEACARHGIRAVDPWRDQVAVL